MAVHGVAAPARPKAARATYVGEDPRVGQSGLHKPIGQLGQCKVFWSGLEGWCSGLSWAKKAGRTGRYGVLRDEKSEKERVTGGLPRLPGQNWFGPR
jgi:hypothetical protein